MDSEGTVNGRRRDFGSITHLEEVDGVVIEICMHAISHFATVAPGCGARSTCILPLCLAGASASRAPKRSLNCAQNSWR